MDRELPSCYFSLNIYLQDTDVWHSSYENILVFNYTLKARCMLPLEYV